MSAWQINEAAARLPELLCRAETDGPQTIMQHGRPVAVVLSCEAYQRLSGQHRSLVDFMHASPLAGLDESPVFDRNGSLTRDESL